MSDLGIAGFTLVGVIPALIIIGIVFAVAGVSLYLAGLVSAMIYLLAGVGFLWIAKLFGVFHNPWGYLFLLVLPVMFVWGWGVDHISFLSIASPASWLASSPQVVLPMNDLSGSPFSFDLTFQNFGSLMSIVGGFIAIGTVAYMKIRKKHR